MLDIIDTPTDLKASTALVPVKASLNPLGIARADLTVREGMSIAEIFEAVQPDAVLRRHAHIFIGDKYVPRDEWATTVPKAGNNIAVSIRSFIPPQGGGGSGAGKNILRSVLLIAVIAASFLLGPALGGIIAPAGFLGMTSAGVGQAIIGMVGMLAINALVPVGSGKNDAQGDSQTLFIEGASNRGNPFGPVNVPFGTFKVVPMLGARPYTEIVGDDQYLRMLFVWGIGRLDLSGFKIGDTDLTEFTDYQVEHREGTTGDAALTLYPSVVDEEQLAILLAEADGWQTRTSSADADELSVDFAFFQGLITVNSKGKESTRSVQIQIQYSVSGANSWQDIPKADGVRTFEDSWIDNLSGGVFSLVTFTQQKRVAIRHSITWKTPSRGQYDIRIRRITADNTDEKIQDEITWTALRRFTNESPINSPTPIAVTAIRIKATNQLNGVIDQFSGITKRYAKHWNGSAWVEQLTNNPAAAFRFALQGGALQTPLADNRLDLTGLAAWSEFCATEGFEYNWNIDYQTNLWDILKEIAAAGRASPSMVDGKWSVVIDQEQTIPVSHVTPRNSYGFTATIPYIDLPHFFRIRFPNADEDYRQDEHRIYINGYTAETGTKSETMDLPGITDPDLIARHARFHASVGLHRSEQWSYKQDIEFLSYRRGDMILITHDVIAIGKGYGRIKAVEVDGSDNVTAVTVDEELTIADDGNDYGMSIRTVDKIAVTAQISDAPGTYKTVNFVTPIPAADAPSIGDLFGFGILGYETDRALVMSIIPETKWQATINCVPYRDEVFTDDAGPLPPFSTHIAPPVTVSAPVIANVYTLGPGVYLRPRVVIMVRAPEVTNIFLDVQIRPHGTNEPYVDASILARVDNGVVIDEVQVNDHYDFRVRWRGSTIVPTAWANTDYTVEDVEPGAVLPDNVVTIDALGLTLQALTAQLQSTSDAAISRILDDLHSRLEALGELHGQNWAVMENNVSEIIFGVGQVAGDAKAQAIINLSAIADETSARAELTTLLEAIFGDDLATVNTALSAASTDMLTTALAFVQIFASNAYGDASALFNMTAQAAPSGVGALLELQARASTGDAFASAGMRILAGVDALSGGGMIEFTADRFTIKNGSSQLPPFVISGSDITLNGSVLIDGDAVIDGSLTVGKIQSNDITVITYTESATPTSGTIFTLVAPRRAGTKALIHIDLVIDAETGFGNNTKLFVDITLKRGGSTLTIREKIVLPLAEGGATGTKVHGRNAFAMSYYDEANLSGDQTYTVEMSINSTSDVTTGWTPQADDRSMSIFERAA